MARWLWYGVAVLLLLGLAAHVHAQEGDPNRFPPGQDYYVEAFVSTTMPFVGQRVTYVLRFYAYVLPETLDSDLPDFAGFWLGDVYQGAGAQVAVIHNRQYYQGEIYAEVFPLRPGELIIEPAAVMVPETVFRAAETVSTAALRVQVQPLPEAAPAGFAGAVGQFDLLIDAQPRSVAVGQPVRLTAVITGSGNLEQMAAPVLNVPDGWRIYTSPSAYRVSDLNGLRLGEKAFEWLLVPDFAGSQVLSSPELIYFDPEQGEYVSLSGDTFGVDVSPSRVPPGRVADTSGVLPLRSITPPSGAGSPLGSVLLWLVPPGIVCSGQGWRAWKRRRERHMQQIERAGALARALKKLSVIGQSDTLQAEYLRIAAVIDTYLAERLSPSFVFSAVYDDLVVEEAIVETAELRGCWLKARERAYAPAGLEGDPTPLIEETRRVLRAFDEAVRP